ncbi:MAG: hypothetical protein K0U98_21100 [Deltaproteobacteria bacterium]|nr:hypothetical protein [Deltaproteobacteria bacterium]
MKKNYLVKSAVALCFLASFFLLGTAAEARDTEPDRDNCWYAGITVYCHSYWSTQCSDGTFDESCRHLVLGPSNGWGRGGGATAASCQTALHSLLVDAAWAGCRVQEGSPSCRHENGDCRGGDNPDDGDPDDEG